ncbi:unnamed protein product [Rotaria magnacalcarata]|uniref:Reverse transcriptase domain-containing protein n=1 Tax=Rotaria magnacalcarata TaxID=392030 RepID=A0A816FUD4_9BILA|nr:unnamed protein product [Rotaria magnacalcarata]
MPFGLTNAAATFQRLMDLVLGGLKWSCAPVYLDDIIVYSSSFNDHLHHIELVLEQIQQSGLTLKRNKCQFCKTHLKYLGHIVSKEGIRPDPDELTAVREYPVPTKLKAGRTFLDCQKSFDTLRQCLIEAPIIAYPLFDQSFILQLDVSDIGLSAILAQKLMDDDGISREHIIGYASRTLSTSERKYSSTEREWLAIVYGCSYYRPYLEGIRFTPVADHKALKWLQSTKDLNS